MSDCIGVGFNVCACVFKFMGRTGGIAHCLARKGVRSVGVLTWEAYAPIWVAKSLVKDGCFC